MLISNIADCADLSVLAIVCTPRSCLVVILARYRFVLCGFKIHVFRLKKGWFPYDRGSQIADRNKSAIVCDHMETHFCDRLRSCDRDRRRSQKIEPCSISCDRLRSSAIIYDQLRLCNHMETKVLRFAIETHPIIFAFSPMIQRSCVRL